MLHVQIGGSRIHVMFKIFRNLAAFVFLGTSFIDKFIKGIFPTKCRKVPFNSAQMTSPTAQKAETDKTGYQQIEGIISITAERDHGKERVRVTRTVTLQLLYEASFLVGTNGKSILQVATLELFDQRYLRKVARDLMDVYPRKPLYIIFANTSKSVIKIAKHQHFTTTNPRPFEIIPIKSNQFSQYQPSSISFEAFNVVHYKPTPDGFQHMNKMTQFNKITNTASTTIGKKK